MSSVARNTAVRSAIERLGLPWSPRALDLFFLQHAYDITAPRVQAGPLSETDALAPNYIEWLRTMYEIAQIRALHGQPYGRMLAILGVVAAVTFCSALLFRSKTMKAVYGIEKAD